MADRRKRAVGVVAVAALLVLAACSSDSGDAKATGTTKKTEPTVLGNEVTRSTTTTAGGAVIGPELPTSTSTTAAPATTTTARSTTQATTQTTTGQRTVTTRTQTTTTPTTRYTCPSGGIGWRASMEATGSTGAPDWTLHLTGTLTNGANATVRVSSVSVYVNYSPPAGEPQANPVFTFTPSPSDLAPGASVGFDAVRTVRSTTKPTVASLTAAVSWADASVPASCPPPKTTG